MHVQFILISIMLAATTALYDEKITILKKFSSEFSEKTRCGHSLLLFANVSPAIYLLQRLTKLNLYRYNLDKAQAIIPKLVP